jgi:hypothetical protein
MPLKKNLKGMYYRTRGPLSYLGAIAGLALLLIWLLSVLDIRIPEVNLEPQTLLIESQLLVIYILLWLVMRYRQRYRVLKLKLDARESTSGRQVTQSEKAHTSRPSTIQVVRMPRPPLPSSTVPSSPKGKILMKRTFILRRDEIWDYRVKVRIGAILNARIESSSPVDMFLLDEWHYFRENYDNPEEEESDALVAEFRVECKKDSYYLTVMNEGQKNARIEVEASLE